MSRIDPDVCAGHGKPCVKKAVTQTMFGCNKKKQRLQTAPQRVPRDPRALPAPTPWSSIGVASVV